MAFSDALDREAAWLQTTTDTLPNLVALFDIIQARWPRAFSQKKSGIYVLRQPDSARIERFAAQRSMLTHHLRLHVVWPFRQGTGSAENEQLNFDQAIDQILQRVQGPLGDKTHGGRFLSAAENPSYITVSQAEPAQSVSDGQFTAQITYYADDPDYAN